jgi:hypothetical protein
LTGILPSQVTKSEGSQGRRKNKNEKPTPRRSTDCEQIREESVIEQNSGEKTNLEGGRDYERLKARRS